jgi:hypothetical protein
MNTYRPAFFRAVGRYTAALRAMRDEIRTERLLNSLPNEIRKDIGWPEGRAARRAFLRHPSE